MADLYRNLLVNSYPTHSQTLAQISSWDKTHQDMFLQQMQVLLDAANSTTAIISANATNINQAFAEIYQNALAQNRYLNIQRYDDLAENAQNIEQLEDAYNHTQKLADVAQRKISDSMQTRYGQKLDEFRQKAAGVKQYIWASMGDEKVRASHAALDGKMFSWNDSPKLGEESGCRCSAVPASFFDKNGYEPEEDYLYMAGYYTWGQIAALDLKEYEELIKNKAIAVNSDKTLRQIDPELIKGVITNEVITRLGASGGDAILSGINSLFNDSGNGGTYGPAQLGREARLSAGLTISDSLTYEGAIRGAANWLDKERRDLIKIGIINPTNAQIASRYNMGSAAGAVTKYGVRVQFLIDRLYSK